EQIDAYLKSQGRQTQWIELDDSKRLWGQSLAAAKEKGAVERAPILFAETAHQLYEFDAIVIPSLLLHKTRAVDGAARWDGVRRRMRGAQIAPAQGVVAPGISGDVLVTSVHVLVFSRAGERVFEGRGGIDFVHEVDTSTREKNLKRQFQVRDLSR